MPVTWSRRAQADFTAIYNRALDEDARYALNLVESLDAALARLADFSRLGTPVGSHGHCKWRLGKTPFLIIYADEDRGLNILRVYHERLDWGFEP
ncbi:type II toxin-antitoxin system RelE/ParE family toxin [Blastomonas sp. AAP53]|uniref:type II toxin-antitoxin system RelE/ParE family toxin n=1 Tax=Blastomonas sp. AAP53 TaxID=1248760 RepID=UPI0002DA653D|nr:type II toxin-antitoxin system RelE/ParE family toxin [Blastomonas sp. AAP53]